MTPLAFIDTETTGLDPDTHEIWEVALILRRVDRHEDGHEEHLPDEEYLWQLPVDLGRADPAALNIGHFHDRRWVQGRLGAGLKGLLEEGSFNPKVISPSDLSAWAGIFTSLTRGAHLVGNVVSFDEERLRKLLRQLGQCPMWHYHLVDVECLVAGWDRGRRGSVDPKADLAVPPWRSDDLSRLVGVDPTEYDRHTALGDARWARDLYDAVMGQPAQTKGNLWVL